jgi:cell division protein FtsX
VVRNYRALMQKKDIDQIQIISKEDFERELSDHFSSGT